MQKESLHCVTLYNLLPNSFTPFLRYYVKFHMYSQQVHVGIELVESCTTEFRIQNSVTCLFSELYFSRMFGFTIKFTTIYEFLLTCQHDFTLHRFEWCCFDCGRIRNFVFLNKCVFENFQPIKYLVFL